MKFRFFGKMVPFENADVAASFDAFPTPVRGYLLALRGWIFDVAAATDGVGIIHETLKWRQPSYAPVKKAGTALRLNIPKLGGFALYVSCQTSLIADFRQQFPDLQYDGTRAIEFCEGQPPDRAQIETFIRRALTYYL